MFKFFRAIRIKSILNEKFNKYLLYVLGEILLVVIGILIALKINNYNKIKENKVKEDLYLQSFHRDLKKDIGFIKEQLQIKEYLFAELEETFFLLPELKYKNEEELNNLSNRLSLIASQNNFVCSCSTYEAIQNSSHTQLISDFS